MNDRAERQKKIQQKEWVNYKLVGFSKQERKHRHHEQLTN